MFYLYVGDPKNCIKKGPYLKIGLNTNEKKKPMKLYTHLELRHAREIITLANKGISIYKIIKLQVFSKDKIKRCLEGYKKESKKINMKQPWKDAIVLISYLWKNYKEYRNQIK